MIEGYWYRTILWEVPLMSLISELYYVLTAQKRVDDDKVKDITRRKMEAYKALDIKIAEFGSRRRHSYRVQEMVVETLQKYGGANYIGTSNVRLAMDYNVIPIGTHAHEWFMFHAAYFGYKMAQPRRAGQLGQRISRRPRHSSFRHVHNRRIHTFVR